MGRRAAVHDRGAAVLMLCPPDARIGDRAVWLPELTQRNVRQSTPKLIRSIDVQALVQVETQTQTRLVNREEPTQPKQKERNHPRVAVREYHGSIGLAAFR